MATKLVGDLARGTCEVDADTIRELIRRSGAKPLYVVASCDRAWEATAHRDTAEVFAVQDDGRRRKGHIILSRRVSRWEGEGTTYDAVFVPGGSPEGAKERAIEMVDLRWGDPLETHARGVPLPAVR